MRRRDRAEEPALGSREVPIPDQSLEGVGGAFECLSDVLRRFTRLGQCEYVVGGAGLLTPAPPKELTARVNLCLSVCFRDPCPEGESHHLETLPPQ
jgi:hypothetical protein